ncbi:outer dynein arm-docking complex subunit 3 isoform X2 [Amia ocellicauda]|uniref:outer dynein arm-docking complex subunit 3 isoform X2 n=1 Tax=Amia ocellicauda TaxID=2972642 RepID=UPI003463FE45
MPATFKTEGIKLPVHQQIAELQRKIQLLEGDRSAYYERSQCTIKKNKDTILQLRQQNKKLHKKLADTLAGDERVIKVAFQDHSVERAAMRNKTGMAAMQIVDQKVCDKMKKLNALRYNSETRQRRLVELQAQYSKIQQESQTSQPEPTAEEAKNLRVLENRLEKAQLKCQEAEHIMKVYLELKAHLQAESLTFQTQLDGLEVEILRQRQELKKLEVMNRDAHLSRDAAKAELQRQEEMVYRERREREKILAEYKKQADERKAQAERVERRAQRANTHPDELSSEAHHSPTGVGVEEEKTITTLEEAFQRIKEATGVTDTREVVQRFVSQGDTRKHLEQLKEENEKTLLRLREEKERLEAEFQEMKYSGEAKLSSGQQMLEECEAHLRAEEKRRDAAKEQLERLTRTLNTVSAGVEHLSDKLQHIKLPKSHVPAAHVPSSSDEHVLELLSQSEQKLLLLMEELKGKDLGAIMKEMEEEEFHTSIEGKLPDYNMRIKLPETQKQDPYDDEESGEDESDVVTRAALKRQSQLIIDSKTKRKTRGKKKKDKH